MIAEIVGTPVGTLRSRMVTAAFTYLNADDYMGGDLERPAAGKVGAVLAILEAQLPEPEEGSPAG